jgi:hypothetical protein
VRVYILDMDRHKTYKHVALDADEIPHGSDRFKDLLDNGTQEAYKRPWHRIERGLRLNRLRIFIEDVSSQFNMTEEEKKTLFIFLQKSLDKKLLNTIKVVQYSPETQRIMAIKGFEIKRNAEGELKWAFKQKVEGTRKRKKDDSPFVSTETVKIEEKPTI